ncbi:hypothetical protein Tco_0590933 [Tanacetum coccineum]
MKLFKQLRLEIGLKDALIEMPKFNKWLSTLLRNKEKLEEIAITTVNAEYEPFSGSTTNHSDALPLSSSPVKTSEMLEEFADELTLFKKVEETSDPLHHEFAGELLTLPSRIVREHEDYLNRMTLLCEISTSRSQENVHANPSSIIESLPVSLIPVEDNDLVQEEIDIFLVPDDLIPLGVENDDSEDEDNELPNLDHQDNPSSPRPPPEPPDTNDGFQTVSKKKKGKGKSKSTNGGQFVGLSVKQNVRYEPKETTSAPKKGATNVGNPSTSSSYSVLNDEEEEEEEDVENVYAETANLFIKTGRSSSFTAAVEEEEEEDVENVYVETANLFIKTGGSSSFTAAVGKFVQLSHLF